jgi:hypothetical protein
VNSQYPQYQDPQFYGDAPVPRRRRLDTWTIALIAAVGLAGCTCLVAVFVLFLFVFAAPPPAPATPKPIVNAGTVASPGSVLPAATATLDPANVGKVINPAVSAALNGMTVLQIDVLDQATGNYTRAAQLTGTDLDIFSESFNISVETVAPNTDCPDHLRFSITRRDNSVVTMGVCLKQVVILRGIPDLGGADAPMGPRFSDALAPFLPDAYKALLNY